MAHGYREEYEITSAVIRDVGRKHDLPTAVLVDLAGPKIRLGQLFEDPLQCIGGFTIDKVR